MKIQPYLIAKQARRTAEAGPVAPKDRSPQFQGRPFQDNRPSYVCQARLRKAIDAIPPGRTLSLSKETRRDGTVIQREPFDMGETRVRGMVERQVREQGLAKYDPNLIKEYPVTTVGFEYEFAQFDFSSAPAHPLKDVTHVVLIESEQKMPFSNLPFSLETDADNAIELVTPPFLIRTIGRRPIPHPGIVEHVNNQMKAELLQIAGKADSRRDTGSSTSTSTPAPRKKKGGDEAQMGNSTFQDLLKGVSDMTGFHFPSLGNIKIKSANVNPGTRSGGERPDGSFPQSETAPSRGSAMPTSSPMPEGVTIPATLSGAHTSPDEREDYRIVPSSLIKGLKTKPSTKDPTGISEQINIATDAFAYDALKSSGGEPGPTDGDFLELENSLKAFLSKHLSFDSSQADLSSSPTAFPTGTGRKRPIPPPAPFANQPSYMRIFLNELARNLSQCIAVEAINVVETFKAQLFKSLPPYNKLQTSYQRPSTPPLFELCADLRSHVKDVNDVWLKDTLISFARGLFQRPEDYQFIINLLKSALDDLGSLQLPSYKSHTFKRLNINKTLREQLRTTFTSLLNHFAGLPPLPAPAFSGRDFANFTEEEQMKHCCEFYPFLDDPVPFGGHHLHLPGVRHDTFIHPTKVNRLPAFYSSWLHVVEIRENPIKRLRALEDAEVKRVERVQPLEKIKEKRLRGPELQEQFRLLLESGEYIEDDIALTWGVPIEKLRRFLSRSFGEDAEKPIPPPSEARPALPSHQSGSVPKAQVLPLSPSTSGSSPMAPEPLPEAVTDPQPAAPTPAGKPTRMPSPKPPAKKSSSSLRRDKSAD